MYIASLNDEAAPTAEPRCEYGGLGDKRPTKSIVPPATNPAPIPFTPNNRAAAKPLKRRRIRLKSGDGELENAANELLNAFERDEVKKVVKNISFKPLPSIGAKGGDFDNGGVADDVESRLCDWSNFGDDASPVTKKIPNRLNRNQENHNSSNTNSNSSLTADLYEINFDAMAAGTKARIPRRKRDGGGTLSSTLNDTTDSKTTKQPTMSKSSDFNFDESSPARGKPYTRQRHNAVDAIGNNEDSQVSFLCNND